MNEQEQQRPPTLLCSDQDYGKSDNHVVGIVGHGSMGGAIERSLAPHVSRFLCDPKYNISIDQLCEQEPLLTFVCTPCSNEDFSDTIDAVLKLIRHTKSGVVLKSTLPREKLFSLLTTIHTDNAMARFIYSPDLSSDNNTAHDFVNPDYMIVGGFVDSCNELMQFYQFDTFMTLPTDATGVHICTHLEASIIFQSINAYLAMKTMFFTELASIIDGKVDIGVNYPLTARAIVADPRIGNTHWVGGGKIDTSAITDLLSGHEGSLPLLETIINSNQEA